MMTRAGYWAYVHNNYKWYAWYYVEGEVKIKLGSFEQQKEAQKAVEQYENSNK
jgi:hypothetical protein